MQRCAFAVSLAAALLLPIAAAADQFQSLGCSTPKATIDPKTHDLNRTWVSVYTKPSSSASVYSFKIASPLPLWVVANSGAFTRVATGDGMDGWPFKPHTILGWVRKSDLEDQAIRNCTI